MVTATKIGLLHKLKQTYGLTTMPAKWIGLDGDASAESAAQQAMSQIQAAISQAQSAASAAADWKLVNAGGKYPTMSGDKYAPSKININVSGNTFPSGTKPNDVLNPLIRSLIQA